MKLKNFGVWVERYNAAVACSDTYKRDVIAREIRRTIIKAGGHIDQIEPSDTPGEAEVIRRYTLDGDNGFKVETLG